MEMQVTSQVIVAASLALAAVIHGGFGAGLAQNIAIREKNKEPFAGLMVGTVFSLVASAVYAIMWFICLGRTIATTFWPE